MSEDKHFSNLLKSMQESVDKIGPKATAEKLQAEDSNSVTIKYIIDVVITDWKDRGHVFNDIDFFKPNIRGEVVLARDMIIWLIGKVTILPRKEIAKRMNIPSTQTIYIIGSRFRRLDRDNKYDKIVIERHERLLEKVSKSEKIIKTKSK